MSSQRTLRIAGAYLLGLALSTHAAPKAAAIFSDHMVLQRDIPVPVWGDADPNEEVSVKFRAQTKTTRADAQGNWLVKLDPLQAGGPDDLAIGSTKVSDVLVGEIWIGSGQSNMAMGTGGAVKNDPVLAEMAAKSYPTIRFGSATGNWRVANSNKGSISAPALPLGFAIRLQEELKVPVGMIVGAVPGSSTTYWLTNEHLKADPACQAGLERYAKEALPGLKERYAKTLANWEKSPKASDPATKPAPPAEPGMPSLAHHVTGKFFEEHIRPAIPFAIRGVLWDQGENTCSIDGPDQTEIMHALIQGWRKDWGHEFPWVFIQKPSAGGCAANYDDPLNRLAEPFAPLPDKTPGLRDGIYREYFLRILKTTPKTAMAICSDLSPGLHPPMKSSYSTRAARAAFNLAYGQQLPIYGPTYSGHQIEGNKVILRFDNTGKGLVFKNGDKLQGFMIAGQDRRFSWAEAAITSPNTISVSSPTVSQPASVRYAWAKEHPWANLFNQDGLPAQAFRTDDW
jgi:sialate O-acetylesterase